MVRARAIKTNAMPRPTRHRPLHRKQPAAACLVRSLCASFFGRLPGAGAGAVLAQMQQLLPGLGDGGEMTASAERRLGDQIARELYRDTDYIDDLVLVAYVQAIWQRLLAAGGVRGGPRPNSTSASRGAVLLGRDRNINAFALPGGYLGKSPGAGRGRRQPRRAGHGAWPRARRTSRSATSRASWASRAQRHAADDGGLVLGMIAAGKSGSGDVGQAVIKGSQAAVHAEPAEFLA